MAFIKKKAGTYLLMKLGKVDTKYLRNFKKYEHPGYVKDIDKLFSDLTTPQMELLTIDTFKEVGDGYDYRH